MQADHSFEVPLLVEVARNPQQRVAQDLALVLTARGIEAQIGLVESPKGPRWTLMVEAGDGPRARGELEAFRGENAAWRGPLVYVEPRSGAWVGSAWYVVVMLAGFAFQSAPSGSWEAGIANAEVILGGDWALGFSALLLHADLVHLAGNLFFGALFGFLVAAEIGSGAAWLGILLAGGLGNLMNAVLYGSFLQQQHLSLGASTGVFGAVGILSALGWAHRKEQSSSIWRRSASPVMGLVMLGLYGMTGERTDIGAHGLGLLAGVIVGACAIPFRDRLTERSERAMGLLAGALLVMICWLVWG